MRKELKPFSFGNISFFALISILVLGLIGLMEPDHFGKAYTAYFRLFTVAVAALFFYRRGFGDRTEIKLFLAYVLWLLLTRWLHKDYYLISDMKLVIEVLFSFLLFAVSSLLDLRQREKILAWLIIIFSIFFFMISALGLFTVITNTTISIIPEKTVQILVKKRGGMNKLILLSNDQLTCARWIYFVWSLLVYAFFRYKKTFIRIFALLGIILFHITIPLFQSRNIQIVQSISCAMLAILCAKSALKEKTPLLRVPVTVLVAVAAAALCYMSTNWINTFFTGIRSEYAPQFEEYYRDAGEESNDDSLSINYDNNTIDMSDHRKIIENRTLTGRTYIWRSGIIAVKRNPSIALFGSLSEGFMNTVNNIYSQEVNPSDTQYKFHMHSIFMQVLMQTGIPGLIMVFFWILLLSVKMLRVYFSENEQISFSTKVLTIPITGILIWHITEMGIFNVVDITGHAFFLAAGVFIGFYYDAYPLVKNEKNQNSVPA